MSRRVAGLDDGFSLTGQGGIGRYSRGVYEALAAAGGSWVPAQIRPPRWLVALPALPRRVLYLLWAPVALRRFPADVLHFTNYAVPGGLTVPAVATIHDMAVLRTPAAFPPMYRMWQRMALRAVSRRASVVLTPSEAVRQEVLRSMGVAPDRVLVGGDGSTLAWQAMPRPRSAPAPPYRLLGVGRLERRKSWTTLLDAAVRMQQRGLRCRLTLFGRPGYGFEYVKAKAAALTGQVDVTLVLGADDQTVVRAYQTGQLLVAPSVDEGFDLPILEAMAFGMPVVASDIPVHRELLGEEGLFFRPGDSGDLADEVQTILASPARYESLTQRLPIRARNFGPEGLAQAHVKAYDMALTMSRNRSA